MVMHDNKLTMAKQYTSFAGHFDSHADQAVRCRAHRSVRQVYGYPRCHHMPPLGEYLPPITPVVAMVINFGAKIELWHCETAVLKLAFKRHKTDAYRSNKLSRKVECCNSSQRAQLSF